MLYRLFPRPAGVATARNKRNLYHLIQTALLCKIHDEICTVSDASASYRSSDFLHHLPRLALEPRTTNRVSSSSGDVTVSPLSCRISNCPAIRPFSRCGWATLESPAQCCVWHIVKSDDGQILWDAEFQFLRLLEHTQCQHVTHGQNGGRFGVAFHDGAKPLTSLLERVVAFVNSDILVPDQARFKEFLDVPVQTASCRLEDRVCACSRFSAQPVRGGTLISRVRMPMF